MLHPFLHNGTKKSVRMFLFVCFFGTFSTFPVLTPAGRTSRDISKHKNTPCNLVEFVTNLKVLSSRLVRAVAPLVLPTKNVSSVGY